MAVAEKNWPTTAARDYKGTSPNYLTRKDGKSRADQLAVAVDLEEQVNWPTPTVQEAGKIGNQANHGQLALSNHPAIRGEVNRDKYDKGKHGQAAPANPSTDGSRQESWATPNAFCYQPPENTEQWTKRAEFQQTEKGVNLHKPIQTQVLHEVEKQWRTPSSSDGEGTEGVGNADHGRLASGIDAGSGTEADRGGQSDIEQAEPRQAQPPLGRDADGAAGGLGYAELQVSCDNRTDELRLLGNGVVPATAERAFRILMEEIISA
jgi:hypothetical protein